MQPFLIRLANEKDLEPLFELMVEVVDPHLGRGEWARTLELWSSAMYVAVSRGSVVGCVRLEATGDTPVGWLRGLCVAPAFESMGIGAALTQFVLRQMKPSLIEHVKVSVKDGNVRAMTLYQGLGFYQVYSDSHFKGPNQGRSVLQFDCLHLARLPYRTTSEGTP